jgi:hypothetical protein
MRSTYRSHTWGVRGRERAVSDSHSCPCKRNPAPPCHERLLHKCLPPPCRSCIVDAVPLGKWASPCNWWWRQASTQKRQVLSPLTHTATCITRAPASLSAAYCCTHLRHAQPLVPAPHDEGGVALLMLPQLARCGQACKAHERVKHAAAAQALLQALAQAGHGAVWQSQQARISTVSEETRAGRLSASWCWRDLDGKLRPVVAAGQRPGCDGAGHSTGGRADACMQSAATVPSPAAAHT